MANALLEVAGGVLVELRDLVEELDAARRVVAAADLHLVGADQLLVVADLAVERLEEIRDDELVRAARARGARARRARCAFDDVALEDRAVALDGLTRPAPSPSRGAPRGGA